jgi:hypothetical protein
MWNPPKGKWKEGCSTLVSFKDIICGTPQKENGKRGVPH